MKNLYKDLLQYLEIDKNFLILAELSDTEIVEPGFILDLKKGRILKDKKGTSHKSI